MAVVVPRQKQSQWNSKRRQQQRRTTCHRRVRGELKTTNDRLRVTTFAFDSQPKYVSYHQLDTGHLPRNTIRATLFNTYHLHHLHYQQIWRRMGRSAN